MRYLLGTLSDEERARLEERYFSDDAMFEEIEIAEEELIDRYVRGELSRSDADRFAATVAGSSRIAERVEFARVWKDKIAATPLDQQLVTPIVKQRESDRERLGWWQKLFGPTHAGTPILAYAMLALIFVVGAIALLAGWLRIREQSRQLAAQQAALEQRQRDLDKQAADLKNQLDEVAGRSPQPTPTEAPKQVETPSPPNERSFVALTLSPGGTRSQGSHDEIRIAPGTQYVRITLNVSDTNYSSYQAVVLTAERKRVFPSGPLRLRPGGVLIFNVPANKLSQGDYSVSLTGRTATGASEPLPDYQFRVIK